ncbi:transmembrane protein [Babesia ovis]|uniref:Transmembrane protein n=1 Tax=Babesia ovis TaxID=5869 RepID=A0A9W5TDE0_BABOV|nr:transmembrane protein [Babesia ovis]
MGALKRNIVIECVYLVFYFISLFLIFLTVLDMAELVHLLPKGPQLHDVSDFASMRAAAFLRAAHAKPFMFIKQRDMPFALGNNDTLDLNGDDLGMEHSDHKGLIDADSTASTDVEDNTRYQNIMKAGTMQDSMVNQHIQNDLDNVEQNALGAAAEGSKLNGVDTIPESDHNSVQVTQNAEPGTINHHVANNSTGRGVEDHGAPLTNNNGVAEKDLKTGQHKKHEVTENKTETFYDSLPLVPHIGETEGEAEEVSKDELPPETHDLTPEGVSEVVAIYKIQKRPLKMAAAGLLTIALIFNIYCYWVAVTFVLNKCTCLDELVSHPEQFTPLID